MTLMISVTRENFDSLAALRDTDQGLRWTSVFHLPVWMKVWWQQFDGDVDPHILSIKNGGEVIGVAPLRIDGTTAHLIGSDNVCDYLDFVTVPGKEESFFGAVLDYVKQQGATQLDLGLLRPDSTVVGQLADVARGRGMHVDTKQEDVSSEMDLPDSFEGYLGTLDKKQRHEVRRKIRRLEEAGKVDYQCLNGKSGLDASLDAFLHLFSLARDEKAQFMTPEMESFFRAIAHAMAGAGLLWIGKLDFDGKTAAMVMCFDYNDSVYLYNSGYDPQYDSLSVGLLSKVFCIREGIQQGRKRFEFLKGNEIYKQRLGGKEIPLYRCNISIS